MKWGSRRAKAAPAAATGGGEPAGPDVLALVAERLNETSTARWRVKGDRVQGPGRVAVVLGAGHDYAVSDGHVDLDVVLDTVRPEATTLSDCASGSGETRAERLGNAVSGWGATTAAAVLELLEGRGRRGERFTPDHPKGLPGWLAVRGGIVGLGSGPERQAVMLWAREQSLLRLIASSMTEEQLGGPGPIGIKFFWGSAEGKDAAEVRINGEEHQAAGAALLAADWPRPKAGASYARTYFILEQRA